MRKRAFVSVVGAGVIVAALGAVAIALGPIGKKPGGGGGIGGCPRQIECLDVWDPVICDDGNVYSNDCYAYRACATGCVPYGDILAAKAPGGGLGGCPRPIECLDIYDPVTCSNGVTYPNACYAYRACATGCGSSGT